LAIKEEEEEERLHGRVQEEEKKGLVYEFVFPSFFNSYFHNAMLNLGFTIVIEGCTLFYTLG
jgi:hypothetical protein